MPLGKSLPCVPVLSRCKKLSPPLSESTDDVGEEPGLGLSWQHSKYKLPSPYVGVLCHPSWRFTHILTKIEIDIIELFLKVLL